MTEHYSAPARHAYGLPPVQHAVPYRNIRELLSSRQEESARHPYLLVYNAPGDREKIAYSEFSARVNQVANFLQDDIGVRRGQRVAVMCPDDDTTVLTYFACWLVGASVVPLDASLSDDQVMAALNDSGAAACLVEFSSLDRIDNLVMRAGGGQTVIQVGGERTDQHIHFRYAVGSRPTTYFTEEHAAITDEAVLIHNRAGLLIPLTQAHLLASAQAAMLVQGITANQKVINTLPLSTVAGIIFGLLLPLYAGGTALIDAAAVSGLWRRAAAEKAHVLCLTPRWLNTLLENAVTAEREGLSIWGEGVNRMDLIQVRHVICDGELDIEQARAFEGRYGFPILNGLSLPETTGFCAFLPISRSWKQHNRWMYEEGAISIGSPIYGCEIEVLGASGEALAAGEQGELAVRGYPVMDGYLNQPDATRRALANGWLHTDFKGFYKEDEIGRRLFFIT